MAPALPFVLGSLGCPCRGPRALLFLAPLRISDAVPHSNRFRWTTTSPLAMDIIAPIDAPHVRDSQIPGLSPIETSSSSKRLLFGEYASPSPEAGTQTAAVTRCGNCSALFEP